MPAASRPLRLGVALLVLGSCSGRGSGVRASGTIEMDEIDVASMVGGRVASLRVDEGDTVRAGDTLAVLDRGEVVAELVSQAAQAARATAQLEDVRAGPRPAEIESARAELKAATAQAEFAAADLERIRKLYEQRVASASDYDRARTTADAAAARRTQAAERLRLLEEGSRKTQIAAAQHAADAARAQVTGARTRFGELSLLAPSAGVVLLRNFQPGELVAPNVPVVTLGNPERLWMRCYVDAPRLPGVRLGAPAEIRVDGENRVFRGRVTEIATRAEFTPRAALTEEERANLVFGVKVTLDPTHGTLKPGLPAEARILEPGR